MHSVVERIVTYSLGVLLVSLAIYIVKVNVTASSTRGPEHPQTELDSGVKSQEERSRAHELQRMSGLPAAEQMDPGTLIQQREAAWAAHWKPSEYCLQEASVECGNAYIRARREFERRFVDGEFRGPVSPDDSFAKKPAP